MKLRIHRDALELGMFIERAVLNKSGNGSNNGSVNYVRNVLIDSSQKLDKIKQSDLKFVFIDTKRIIKPATVEKKTGPKQSAGDNNGKKQPVVVQSPP